MKKILMITALCAVIMASVGCKKNENVENNEVNNPNTNIEQPVEDNKEPEQPVEDNKEPEVVEPGTSEAYLDLEKVINGINEESKIQISAPFNMEIMPDASIAYLGISEEDYKNAVKVGVATESMMMPSNQSYCLLEVKEGTDVEALKQKIFDNCNPRKWICMGAEYVLVAGNNKYVMLAMGPKENCNNFLKAFESKTGKSEKVLERTAEEF